MLMNFLIIFILIIEKVLSGVTVTQIDNTDLYVFNDGLYFGMFMITSKGIIVVDAPPSIANSGQTITQIISQYSSKSIKWVIYSHHHLDHIGAASQFPADAQYICHEDAAEFVETTDSIPRCTKIVKNQGYKLKIDDHHEIQLDYHGTIHSEGNLYIYVPQSKLLMVVDFVFPQWGPYHSLGMQSSLVKYFEAYDIVLEYDFNYYIGGHVDRIGTRSDIILSQQMFNDLKTSVQQAINTINYNDVVNSKGGYTGTNTFTIYRAYIDEVVNYCVDVMINDLHWDTKLIDANAFMDTHCFLVFEYFNVNY